MNNQEAINILGQYDVSNIHFYTTDGEEIPFTEWSDAIEMAISALQAQDVLDKNVGKMAESEGIRNDMTNIEAYKWLYEHFTPCGDETKQDAAVTKALEALKKQIRQKWIPCNPSELPKDKKLWVTHNRLGCRYVDDVYWDMTEWSDDVSDVVAYMPYVEPEPYREDT